LNPVIGALVPPPPWEGLLVGVSAKAVSILHADGALVSVIGDTSWMLDGSPRPGPPGWIRVFYIGNVEGR